MSDTRLRQGNHTAQTAVFCTSVLGSGLERSLRSRSRYGSAHSLSLGLFGSLCIASTLRGGVWRCTVYVLYGCTVYELYELYGRTQAPGQCGSAVWLYGEARGQSG